MADTLPWSVKRRIYFGDYCWIWTLKPNSEGYGRATLDKRTWYAHRLVYTLLVGPIPDGLVLDHLCRVRRCVNPVHLDPVTQGTNVRRGAGPQLTAMRPVRTHCKRGHEMTRENTILAKQSRSDTVMRQCRTCRNARDLARYYKKRRST